MKDCTLTRYTYIFKHCELEVKAPRLGSCMGVYDNEKRPLIKEFGVYHLARMVRKDARRGSERCWGSERRGFGEMRDKWLGQM